MSEAAPRRTYRIVLDMEADSYEGLLSALDNLVLQFEREPRPEGCEITSGGWGSGYHVEITHDESQTGDNYRRQLTVWCDAPRAARKAAAE